MIQDGRQTDIRVRCFQTGGKALHITVPDVYREHYHNAEYHNGHLYVIRRLGYDGYPDEDWTDELWRYDSQGRGTRLYSEQGLDFRVAPSEAYIAVRQGQDKVTFLDSAGNPQPVFALGQLSRQDPARPPSAPATGLLKWSDDRVAFWGVVNYGPGAEEFFWIEPASWQVTICDVSRLRINWEYDLNANTGYVAYSDYPAMFGAETASSKAPPYGGFWLEGGPIAGAAGRLEVYDGIVVLRDGQYREVGRLAGRDWKLEAYLFDTARAHLDASAYQAAYGRFCEVVQRFSLLTPAAPPTRVMAPAPAVASTRTPVPGPAAGAAILFARGDDLWRADLNGKEERLTEGEALGWGSQEYAQKAIAALPSVSLDGRGDPEVVVEDGFLLDVIPQWQGVPGVQSRGWAVTALAARQRGNLCHLFLKTRLAQPCTRGPGWASLGVSGLAAT